MTKKIIKIGKELGIEITPEEMKRYGIETGDKVKVTLEPIDKLNSSSKAKARLIIQLLPK